MSFLTRLFGGISKKKDEFLSEHDLRRKHDNQMVDTNIEKQATPSPKGSFLRSAGEMSKGDINKDQVKSVETTIEITVDKNQLPAGTLPPDQASTTLPAASVSEGSSATKSESGSTSKLPEPAVDESKNTLVIKNLPFKFTKPELDQLLSTHEAKAKNVRMLRDGSGRFTGIAFIRCPSKEEAGRLILAMNNLDIGGRGIQVEFKKKKKKGSKKEQAPSAATPLPPTQGAPYSGYPPVSHMYAASGYNPMLQPQTSESRRAFLTASAPSQLLRTSGGLRNSNFLASSTSSVEDEDYLSHIAYPSRRRMSLNSSTSSVDDEDYLPRHLASSTDDPNQGHGPYPNSRLSLSSSGNSANARYATASFSNLPSVRPTRQPIGPDGKSNGFSSDYRKSRHVQQK